MEFEDEDDLLRDDGPDVDLINDAVRDDRLMREAEVEAGKLCSTCQRCPPAVGLTICLICKADEEQDDLAGVQETARTADANIAEKAKEHSHICALVPPRKPWPGASNCVGRKTKEAGK